MIVHRWLWIYCFAVLLSACGLATAADFHIPTAQPLTVTTARNAPVQIQFSAVDNSTGNGAIVFTYTITSQPMHGTVGTIGGDHVTYTPALNYVGADSFTYIATDINGDSLDAPVNISVTAAAPSSSIAQLPTLQMWGVFILVALLIGFAARQRYFS